MTFKFIDLFCGVGGFRLAFDRAGGTCVFSSEWDKHAQDVYEANHGDRPHGDITKIESKDIPDHDVLVGGFPCQAFSVAGIGAKNHYGKAHGFLDQTKGTLFFEIARILRDKRPRAFLLENVANLLHHDNGATFRTVFTTLENELGYHVDYKVINAKLLVPQSRNRVFIVGFKEPIRFEWPHIPDMKPRLRDVLEENPDPSSTLSEAKWAFLQRHREKCLAKGQEGFAYKMADLDGVSATLLQRYYIDGRECLIDQWPGRRPRMLTPRECARLQGFPDSFKLAKSKIQAYRQFGNSVAVPIVERLAKAMVEAMERNERRPESPFLENVYL